MTGFLFFPAHASVPRSRAFYQLHSAPNVSMQLLRRSQGNQQFFPVYLVAACFLRRAEGRARVLGKEVT